MSSRYTPIAQLLPAVFQTDAESFDQIDSYLSLVDELQRGYLDRLEQLDTWLSPNGPKSGWPLDTALDAGADSVIAAYEGLLEELASWSSFSFPTWWAVELEDGSRKPDLARRREYLARATRFWRRRGTPRGFLDWICFAFGIDDAAHRPYLLEHFKFGRPQCDHAEEPGPEPWLRASLLVPSPEQFDSPEMRRILLRFVQTYAPAHVHVRVCFVDTAFELYQVTDVDDEPITRALPGPRPRSGIAAWRAEVADFREHVQCLLCALVGNTSHDTAIRVFDCIDEGQARDRLGIGRLPGGGTFVGDGDDS